ncbi:blue-light photoreceptor PHR2-like [Aristolochia californica]|uniref:blue-light photoreceptor PHR2-like n=1 Tax=Aristolochia californica TaxID=171875 RepID=UPI0035E1BA67
MDPNPKVQEDPIQEVEEEAEVTTLASFKPSPLLSTASISLSLSHLLLPPKPASSLLSPPCCKFKIPSQISSLSHISLSASSATSKSSIKSTISAVPLQSPLFNRSRRAPDPSNPFGLRRATVVWFRNDLRLHDNEALSAAHNDSLSVLPVYCFDPRDYGKSSSGFDKTGPYRATFLIQSVFDLRRNLHSRGSDLIVRIGKPESVLLELAKAVGAEAVYAHREVSHDEVRTEERIEKVMKEEGIETKYLWGSTLYHIDDLPFKLEDMPSNYGGFRERLQGLEVRKTIKALDQLKGLPAKGDVDVGEIPSLVDLGLNPTATMPQGGKPAANASLVGGETEALQRLQKFASEYQAQPNKSENYGDNIYGANFSCKISPWLAMGCLSPRFMFDELKKSVNKTISATSGQKLGGPKADNGMSWLMFELLWRDFFRFITKKYSSTKRKVDVAPATACTGALA